MLWSGIYIFFTVFYFLLRARVMTFTVLINYMHRSSTSRLYKPFKRNDDTAIMGKRRRSDSPRTLYNLRPRTDLVVANIYSGVKVVPETCVVFGSCSLVYSARHPPGRRSIEYNTQSRRFERIEARLDKSCHEPDTVLVDHVV